MKPATCWSLPGDQRLVRLPLSLHVGESESPVAQMQGLATNGIGALIGLIANIPIYTNIYHSTGSIDALMATASAVDSRFQGSRRSAASDLQMDAPVTPEAHAVVDPRAVVIHL